MLSTEWKDFRWVGSKSLVSRIVKPISEVRSFLNDCHPSQSRHTSSTSPKNRLSAGVPTTVSGMKNSTENRISYLRNQDLEDLDPVEET